MKLLQITLALILTTLPTHAKDPQIQPDKKPLYKTVGKTKLRLHIFNPEGHKATDSRPAIIFFFGGGWLSGTPKQFYPHCQHLASKGIIAISAEYRTKVNHATTPKECVRDAKSAIRWARSHAKELGIDPNKILASGGSAGGHIAAATATLTDFNDKNDDLKVSCIPQALVLFNPVINNGPGGYGYDRVKDYWKKFSPIENLSKTTPPTIIFQGTKDKLIPVATAEKYKALMEKNGTRCDLHLYKDQPHGFFNFKNRLYYDKTITEMDSFLTSLNYLKN